MISETCKVFQLKRQIEREFSELFPNDPPYVVAKLEDGDGFAFSNSSLLQDVASAGDRLVALPEETAPVFVQPISPSSSAVTSGRRNDNATI
jgi:hypothetical protein